MFPWTHLHFCMCVCEQDCLLNVASYIIKETHSLFVKRGPVAEVVESYECNREENSTSTEQVEPIRHNFYTNSYLLTHLCHKPKERAERFFLSFKLILALLSTWQCTHRSPAVTAVPILKPCPSARCPGQCVLQLSAQQSS